MHWNVHFIKNGADIWNRHMDHMILSLGFLDAVQYSMDHLVWIRIGGIRIKQFWARIGFVIMLGLEPWRSGMISYCVRKIAAVKVDCGKFMPQIKLKAFIVFTKWLKASFILNFISWELSLAENDHIWPQLTLWNASKCTWKEFSFQIF